MTGSRFDFLEEYGWPKTVEEAADWVIEHTEEDDRAIIASMPREEMIQFHHSTGMWIRNNFGLWKGNTELLKDSGKEHPDDCSMMILYRVWEKTTAGKMK